MPDQLDDEEFRSWMILLLMYAAPVLALLALWMLQVFLFDVLVRNCLDYSMTNVLLIIV